MTIKFVSNGKINAKGFKALLTGESFQIPNKQKNRIQYMYFFSKSVPRNQSRERAVDKREHTSVVVFLQRSVLHRLKCAAQKVQAFLQFKIEIKMTKWKNKYFEKRQISTRLNDTHFKTVNFGNNEWQTNNKKPKVTTYEAKLVENDKQCDKTN